VIETATYVSRPVPSISKARGRTLKSREPRSPQLQPRTVLATVTQTPWSQNTSSSFSPSFRPPLCSLPPYQGTTPPFSFMASTDASARRPFDPPKKGREEDIPLEIVVHKHPPDQSTHELPGSTPLTHSTPHHSDTDSVATHPPSSQGPSRIKKIWDKHKGTIGCVIFCGVVASITIPVVKHYVDHPNDSGPSVSGTGGKTSRPKGGKGHGHRGLAKEEPPPRVVTQAAARPASEAKNSRASSLA
jgi:hypothetical protein